MTLLRFLSPLRCRSARVAAILSCAVLAACSSGGGTTVDPEPSEEQLPAGVYELAGLAPTLPYTDLEPFRGIVGSARFVALGESTHASTGYYQAKARLIRFMVEQMGFRVLAFESNWGEAGTAARYVASCTGTPEEAVRSLFPVWRDVSVRDLLRWMCEWNSAHPGDPVTFFGFDVQEPWRNGPALRAFVQAAAPGEAARVDALSGCLGASYTSDRFFFSPEYRDHAEGRRNTAGHQQCLAGLADMESWIAANGAALQAATSAAAVEEARLNLLALRAWEDQLWIPDPGGYQSRDFGMSQMVQRLHALYTPGQKTIIWAWNWHISWRYQEVRGFDDDANVVIPRQGARDMGSFLHQAWGGDYLPVGLVGYQVETGGATPPPLQTHPESVERRLHDLQRKYLLVDLRQPLPTLLPAGRTYRVSQEWGDPYRQFAALVYVEHSPPMTYVP